MNPATDSSHDASVGVVVVGAGQAGLAVGYYLRRVGFVPSTDFVILDAEASAGGAWLHAWDSLTLFSPSSHSSLPGWPMPAWTAGFPPADHVREYLARYEERYQLPVKRPVAVDSVRRSPPGSSPFVVDTSAGPWRADAVVSATGTWRRPFWPTYPGMRSFAGHQLHTADYRGPESFVGQHVVVVGGGNSAAQILAEISTVATTTWVTPRPPRFMPDEVDGRDLFAIATAQFASADAATAPGGIGSLGDIVIVPTVSDARDRGVLVADRMFSRIERSEVVWDDGRRQPADAIVWCTGFRPTLTHLDPLGLPRVDGHPITDGTIAVDQPGLYLVGYGDWTGPASATLIGVGRTARDTVAHLATTLRPARS